MVILIKNQLYNLMKIRVTVGSRSDFQRQVESQIADVFFRNLSAFPRDSWCYTSQLCAFHQGPMDSFFTSTPSSKFKLSRNQQSSAVGVLEAGDLTATVSQLCKNACTQVLLLKGSVSKSFYVAKMIS